MPAMTVLFSAWAEGKEKAYSYGGTASVSGGRTRPTMALPTLVMVNDPATPMSIRISGVRDRHRHTNAMVITDAMMVMPIGPPRWVNAVRSWVLVAVRWAMDWSRAGWSKPEIPSCSTTAS